MAKTMNVPALQGKLKIEAVLRLTTGMHIGASKDFSAIGAVDSVVVRDPMTKRPIIPGSSLKGKLRTLLVKATTEGYFLNEIGQDSEIVKRLFGSSEPVRPSRLQFSDLFLIEENAQKLKRMNSDLYMTEIKFENTISRLTAVANPRQIERVPAGAEFSWSLIYNIEDASELQADMQALCQAVTLLHVDYLGGHGSRGYGRVQASGFSVQLFSLKQEAAAVDTAALAAQLEEAAGHALSHL